jgi:hypothetical protein
LNKISALLTPLYPRQSRLAWLGTARQGFAFARRYWIVNVSAVACEIAPLLPVIWML